MPRGGARGGGASAGRAATASREETFALHPDGLVVRGQGGRRELPPDPGACSSSAGISPGRERSCAWSVSPTAFRSTSSTARLFDKVFPAAVGCNVAGSLEPERDVQQQIVLVGHHDSPFIFTFLERFQGIAFIRFLLANGWPTRGSAGTASRRALSRYPGVTARADGHPARGWRFAGLPFALQLYFMMGKAKSPGAGDNLNADLDDRGARRLLPRASAPTGVPLQHTRIVLLSTDGEEIGQRGAIALRSGPRRPSSARHRRWC